MQDNFKAWQLATSKYGLTIKEEDYFPLEGMPGKDVALNLFRIYGRTQMAEVRGCSDTI